MTSESSRKWLLFIHVKLVDVLLEHNTKIDNDDHKFCLPWFPLIHMLCDVFNVFDMKTRERKMCKWIGHSWSEPSSLVVGALAGWHAASANVCFDSSFGCFAFTRYPHKVVTWMTLARVFLAFFASLCYIENPKKSQITKKYRDFPTYNKLKFISSSSHFDCDISLFRHMFA